MHLLKIHLKHISINKSNLFVFCSLCAANMKMDGFEKFFDQPSCELVANIWRSEGGDQ